VALANAYCIMLWNFLAKVLSILAFRLVANITRLAKSSTRCRGQASSCHIQTK
jgi:hypothetical protein